MDLHRAFLNRHQKASMGSYMPQPCSSEFFNPILHFGDKGASCHSFSKDYGNNIPHKSFSYPNCFSNFKVSPEKIITKAMDFTRGMQKYENNLPAMSLTYIVGGFMDHKHAGWNPARQSDKQFDNPLESMWNHLVSKSIEITRTMSCPDPFNMNDFSHTKCSSQSAQTAPVYPDNPAPIVKMTYADVAKMNLSNLKKNYSCPNKPVLDNSSSQKSYTICGKKECKVISPPHPLRNNFSNSASNNRKVGTNNFIKANRDCMKPKFQNLGKSSNSRRPQSKRMHCSLKRELGTKKNNQQFDFDGSMWGKDNSDLDMYEDCVVHSPSGPPVILRVRSISSESDCSSDQSESWKNPRVRSISECSINSVDSDDSFIVFDEYIDDKTIDGSCDESSSDENDECLSVIDCCNGLPQAEFLQCVNSKWNTLPSAYISNQLPSAAKVSSSSLSPCAAFKKVRFACGEALAKVRKLCVWDYAHRAARIGPWEQAARDRARFSSRISSLAAIINPILDPAHRSKIYDLRFAGS